MAATVNVAGLDKADLLVRLFYKTPHTTASRLTEFSIAKDRGFMSLRKCARAELAQNARIFVFLASPIDIDFTTDDVDPARYDAITRKGTFARIVAQMRREQSPECSVNISELNKAELLVRLYVYACDPTMDEMEAEVRHYDAAARLIEKTTYVNNFLGYPIKTELAGKKANPQEYDRLYGEGTFARVVKELLDQQ